MAPGAGEDVVKREADCIRKKYRMHYAEDHLLQSLFAVPSADSPQGHWVIYIHGGAWRDPSVDCDSFLPAYLRLRDSPIYTRINGCASINYRLSPHPEYAEEPQIPTAQQRLAKHPEHVHDVLRAIRFLQEMFGFGGRYILVGHSCGATLAFQTVMGESMAGIENKYLEGVKQPTAIIGVAGIYDIPTLVTNHDDNPAYREFIEGAFGIDQEVWRSVSPARAKLEESWAEGSLVMLAHSQNDGLVEHAQMKMMMNAVSPWSEANIESGKRHTVIQDKLTASHDEIWEAGEQLFAVIEHAVGALVELEGEGKSAPQGALTQCADKEGKDIEAVSEA